MEARFFKPVPKRHETSCTLFNSAIDVTQIGYDDVADGIFFSVLAAKTKQA